MFHHRLDDDFGKTVFAQWYLLSFLSGNVNAGGLLAAGSFVTHLTGFATLFGLKAAVGAWGPALGILSVPAFFLMGAMASAYLVDYRFRKGLKPHYDWVMGAVSVCLLFVAIAGHLNMFGSFSGLLRLRQDYIFLVLLCLASGLQNAAITTASGASVRTTHLTGITTDLGIGLVRAWSSRSSIHPEHLREVRANWLRIGTIVSFTCGSAVGAALFFRLNFLGFLLPAAIAIYATRQARGDSYIHSLKAEAYKLRQQTEI